MRVALIAIQFNHDPFSATGDALNIRRNAVQFGPIPEWQAGLNQQARDSVAAYSIRDTLGRILTVQAQFACDPAPAVISVRAVESRLTGGPSWWSPFAGAVLGEVAATQVEIPAGGLSPFVTLELANARLWSRGVGAHEIEWRWQFRELPGDLWTDFAITRHTIYTLLDIPPLPWRQTPYAPANTELPWSDALEIACAWARAAQSRDEAAAEITRGVFQLGPALFKYDCVNAGSPHYTFFWPFLRFDCSAFLARLRGEFALGGFLNCSDCAAIVSTFANLVGCDLWQSSMGYFFALNPVQSIGSDLWLLGCGGGSFGFHEVAWKDTCTESDPVYDACLVVDADFRPGSPRWPVLPMNLRFGRSGEGLYRDLLAAPQGRQNCAPRPETRIRRMVT